jgi:hypothetical protein
VANVQVICAVGFGFWHQLFNSDSILFTMFTKFPATVEKIIVNDDGTFSMIFDISRLAGDELFEDLATDPFIPFIEIKIDKANKTLELVTSQTPWVKYGESVHLQFVRN